MKKKILSAIILFLFLAGLSAGCLNEQKEEKTVSEVQRGTFKYENDGTVTLGEGLVAYGFYTMEGTIIDNAGEVSCTEGLVEGKFEFQQNIDATLNYGLIVMCDYVQQNFFVETEKTNFYRFSATGQEEVWIPIELEVSDDVSELEIVLISEPDAKLEDLYTEEGFNWNNMYASKNLMVQRFAIEGRGEQKQFETKDLTELNFNGNIGFDLVQNLEEPTVFCHENSGGQASIVLGFDGLDLNGYVVVAFCDWEQVPVVGNNKVCYFEYSDGKNGSCDIIFPEADEETPYQMIAFGVPNRFVSFEWASYRIILN